MLDSLEPELEDLLATLVERHLSIADRGGRWFLTIGSMGAPDEILDGGGGGMYAPKLDVEALVDAGYLRVRSYEQHGGIKFVVAPAGFERYEAQKRGAVEQVEAIAADVIRYIDGTAFRMAFPVAYGLWRSAADLLWDADSEQQLSTIGHKAREAMQAFANALVERDQPEGADSDPAKTINRLAAVVAARSGSLAVADKELLNGLVEYWRGLNSIAQRLEHGGPAKQGEPATWRTPARSWSTARSSWRNSRGSSASPCLTRTASASSSTSVPGFSSTATLPRKPFVSNTTVIQLG